MKSHKSFFNRSSKKNTGFSLIELMVAIAIGLIIVATLTTLFFRITRSNDELAKTNSQIENGRFAIQIIQEDLSHAGFWGDYVPQYEDLTVSGEPADIPTIVPNPCLAYSTPWTNTHVTNLIAIPVQVYETPPAGGGCESDMSTTQQPNTDVLVVRHAETCLPGVGNCEADISGKLYFQASQSYFLPLPRPIPETNCPTSPSGLVGDTVPYILNTTDFNTLHKKNCATVISEKRKFISNIYFVRNYARTEGDGIPTLMVSQFDLDGTMLRHKAPIPLIEGIQSLKIELGIDSISDNGTNIITNTDLTKLYSASVVWANDENLISPVNRGDGSPDGQYITCTNATPCTKDQLANAVAAKIYVLARADSITPGYTDTKTYSLGNTSLGPFNDGFKRHVFSTTVRLVNKSIRRETP